MSGAPNPNIPGQVRVPASASESQAPLTPEAVAAQGTNTMAPLDPSTEKELWQGRSSWRAMYPTALMWLLVAGVAVAALHLAVKNNTATLTVAAIGGAILVALIIRTAWQIWSISYRLTSQRLFVRRGIFSQVVDQTELLRVDDVRVRQSLLQRMLGIGEVEMLSSDMSDKKLLIRDVENAAAIAEHIRRHTRAVQKRTLFMEQI